MKARGLRANDAASLTTALNQLVTDQVDSDHDGVTDVEELTVGSDPNLAAATSDGGPPSGPMLPPPSYGCSGSGGGVMPLAVWAIAWAGFLSFGGRRRASPGAERCPTPALHLAPAHRSATSRAEFRSSRSSSAPKLA
jgi:hypothetical protein